MTQHVNHFIEGASCESSDGRRIDLVNPVTEQVYGSSARGTAADVDRAVSAALAQLERGAWRQLDGAQRRSPLEPRRMDLPNVLANLRAAAGWANQLEGRTIPSGGYFGTPTLSYTVREPVGVVGAIVPWNSPLMITVWKLAALLAAGCTVVIKPSEETPQSALHLAALAKEAGFPDGVINVVTGYGTEVGRALCEHPHIAKISFTGSPEAGREIQRTAGVLFKHVSLELGGKSPQIVFDDASFDDALRGCSLGLFANQGQICAAGSRILVQRHQESAVRSSQSLYSTGYRPRRLATGRWRIVP